MLNYFNVINNWILYSRYQWFKLRYYYILVYFK